jgi:tetratricopeptide (TPR) repeat protein
MVLRLLLRTFCISIVLLACGFFPPLFAQTTYRGEISGDVQEGIVHFSKGEFEEAISHFSNAVALNPKDYMAYYQRAKVHEYRNDFPKAIEDYGRVLECDPTYVLAYYYRGIINQRQKNLDAAIEDYTQIIEKNLGPEIIRANAYNNRGIAYDKKGEYQKAIEDYNDAMGLAPDLVHVYYNRGRTYANMGAYPLAVSDFNKELHLHPKLFSALHYRQALVSFLQKDYVKSWVEVQVLEGTGEQLSEVFLEELDKVIRPAKANKQNK